MRRKFLLVCIVQVIGFLILTLTFSIYNGIKNRTFEEYFSNPYYTRHIFMTISDFDNITDDFFQNIISNTDANTQVVFDISQITERSLDGPYRNYLVKYSESPVYRYRIKTGQDFSYEDTISSKDIAIVGEQVLKYNVIIYDENQDIYFQLNNKNYKVSGTIGSNQYKSNFNDIVLMPMGSFKKNILRKDILNGSGPSAISIEAYICSKNNVDEEVNKIEQNIKDNIKNIENFYTQDIEKENSYDIRISYKMMIVFSVAILALSLINISSIVIDWIKTQIYDISIKMSMGLRKIHIFTSVFKRITLVSFLSLSISVVIFNISTGYIQEFNSVEIIFDINDLIYMSLIAVTMSMVAASTTFFVLRNFNMLENIKSKE